jgi:hypothetical protein
LAGSRGVVAGDPTERDPLKRLLEHLTFANVVACVALFVALGGGAYAALSLPADSVGTAQLKKGAVTPAKLSKAAKARLGGREGARGAEGPRGEAGPKGEKGEPGQAPGATAPDGVRAWARVAPEGEVEVGEGVLAVVGEGFPYCVFLKDTTDVAELGAVVTPVSSTEFRTAIVTTGCGSNKYPAYQGFQVKILNGAGAEMETGFTIVVP